MCDNDMILQLLHNRRIAEHTIKGAISGLRNEARLLERGGKKIDSDVYARWFRVLANNLADSIEELHK